MRKNGLREDSFIQVLFCESLRQGSSAVALISARRIAQLVAELRQKKYTVLQTESACLQLPHLQI